MIIFITSNNTKGSVKTIMNKIPVFYACDDNFVKFTAVSICSLIEHASAQNHYIIHILHTNVCDEMQDMVTSMAQENVEIRFENVSEYLETIHDKLPIRDYYTKTTYFRLFIAEKFPEYEKAIYIDSDTVVLGDVADLYAYDITDYYVGAAHEQAMVQEDVYGTYVEKVMGIDRNQFFNAGVLLINCEQFRRQKILEQFGDLLHIYDFVVTQDEDYLNLICKDHVFFLPQQWNMELFGELGAPEETFRIIHYIMVSKPWHFEDCRCKEYFWRYAKKTPVYEEILQILNSYTDEQRAEDLRSCDRLMQLAIDETNKENNYLNLKNSGKLKSKDRLKVLEKIEQYEREGRFDEDVEDDPPGRELMPDEVDYLGKKLSSKVKSRFTYFVARRYLNNLLRTGQLVIKEIKGLEHYRDLNSGAVITCNHFGAIDSFIMQMAYEASGHKKRKLYRVIREGNYTNFPGFYGMLMRNCNTFPLSSNVKTMEKFMSSMDTVLKKGHFMLVYPEQSMWWNYRKPKPLKKGAFNFAVRSNVPVLPCFITMEDSNVIDNTGFFTQEYTIHIGEPIYPLPDKNRAQNMEYMRKKNFEMWKQIYEETYKEQLRYG